MREVDCCSATLQINNLLTPDKPKQIGLLINNH